MGAIRGRFQATGVREALLGLAALSLAACATQPKLGPAPPSEPAPSPPRAPASPEARTYRPPPLRPAPPPAEPETPSERVFPLSALRGWAGEDHATALAALSAAEAELVASTPLASVVGSVTKVPNLGQDVHDLASLQLLARHLVRGAVR